MKDKIFEGYKRFKEPKGRLMIGSGMTKPKGLSIGGKKIPRKLFKDSDMDLHPDFIDCEPFNPRKQDVEIAYTRKGEKKKIFIGRGIKRFAGKIREKYVGWKAKKPERRAARLEREKYKTGIAEEREKRLGLKHKEATRRLERAGKRTALMGKRQKAMGAMPSMFGTPTKLSSALPSIVTPAPSLKNLEAKIPSAPKPKKRKKKKK